MLGRALQVTGLVLLPMGLLYGVERGPHSMALEMGFLICGVVVFLLGRRLQGGGGG